MDARAWIAGLLALVVLVGARRPVEGPARAGGPDDGDAAPATPGIRILAHSIRPAALVPGQAAARVVTASLADGVRLRWPSTPELDEGAEPLRSAAVRRMRDASGRVRLTLEYPFVAWTPGTHTLGPLRLGVEDGEGARPHNPLHLPQP